MCIGGIRVIVEIDESEFGKMNCGKGKHVKGEWVFGELEKGMIFFFFSPCSSNVKERAFSFCD